MQRQIKVVIVALVLVAACAAFDDLMAPSIRWGRAAFLILGTLFWAVFEGDSQFARLTVASRSSEVYHTNPTSPNTLSLACVRRI
jgi:hypothetical protein